MGVHWEIWLLRGGVHEKPIYRQEFTKRVSWTVCKFKGCLVKKGVGVFEGGGGYTPMHTMKIFAEKFNINNFRFHSFINI